MKGRYYKNFFLFLGIFFIPLTNAYAQTVPDSVKAGVVERTILKKDLKVRLKEKPDLIDWDFKEEGIRLPGDRKIIVKEIIFRNNTVLKTSYLRKVLAKYKNRRLLIKGSNKVYRDLTIGDLLHICKRITQAYKKKGYFLAKAYLPPQDVKEGIITIDIIEGALGEIKIEGDEESSVTTALVKKIFPWKKHRVLNYKRLLRSLLILNDYTNVDAKVVLRQGARLNTIDLVLITKEGKAKSATIGYNNSGSRYVSRHRKTIEVKSKNTIVPGDKLIVKAVSANPSRNFLYTKAEYSFILNSYGTRLFLDYNYSDFNAQREFRSLDSGGLSKVYRGTVRHPVIKSITTNLDFLAGFERKDIQNRLLGALSSHDRLRVAKAGFSGEYTDKWRGKEYYSLIFSTGIPDLWSGLSPVDVAASRVDAGGKFFKTNIALTRIQQLPKDSYLILRGETQLTKDTLAVAEQFSIGGSDSVRGFPPSESLGDTGYFGSLELRFPPLFIYDFDIPRTDKKIKDVAQLSLFFDYGATRLKRALIDEKKSTVISSTGFGAFIRPTDNFSLKIDVGFPVSAQLPSDGSSSTTHVKFEWLF